MLTIGKLGSSPTQLAYYQAQVAAGIEDYYAGRGEAAGVWCGTGAQTLGLPVGGEVDHDGFMALMRGRNPMDGTVLRVVGPCSTVAAVDLTFSAPKSVSVLFAIADERTAGELLAAHERAVAQALGYLEREACFTRRGQGGAESVRGDGFIAAVYRHRMSRAGDPQLHTHLLVANLTRAAGRYTALDAHPVYEQKSAAGAVYRAVLRDEVRERLGWACWRPAGRGLFEIDGVPEAVLRHFSQRRVEIEERALELAGRAAGELSRERMQGIALATRRAKQYGVDGAGWREQARARAAEHGLGHAELVALQQRDGVDVDHPDVAMLATRLSGPSGLTGMHNTFARRHALAEIAGAFSQGATAAQLESATSAYLDDSSVRPSSAQGSAEARFTTVGLLACEAEIIAGAQRRGVEATGTLDGELVDRVLDRFGSALNEDQAGAVRQLTSSGRGVEVVQALAGTGKTTMIGALAAAYQQAGWRVVGAAPTGRAARELRDAAAIPAATMHSLAEELDRTRGFKARTVLVIDEAGMAATRVTAQLFAQAERSRVKVIAVGDCGQLSSVEAGGWLAALSRRQPGPTLKEVIRQHDPEERQALQALHDGQPAAYLDHKQDAVSVHDSEGDALAAAVDQWDGARCEHGLGRAVMITSDNHTREQLNQAARERLKREGALSDRGVQVSGREYAPGDRVITRRNDRYRDVDNGTLATVIEVDGRTHRMLVETDFGQERELDLAYVSQHVEHAYALTGHGAQGATVTWAAVIGRPEEFTREWAYTALSRAREKTALHVISEHPHQDQEREHYAPSPGDRGRAQTLAALHRAMTRSELETLALDQPGADGALAHALTRPAGPMEIITRRSAQPHLQSPGGPPLTPRVAPTPGRLLMTDNRELRIRIGR